MGWVKMRQKFVRILSSRQIVFFFIQQASLLRNVTSMKNLINIKLACVFKFLMLDAYGMAC
jgi:hypothetical protein